MIKKYNKAAVIYGGSGRAYASALKEKIEKLESADRYPVSVGLILEQVLTGELLNDVISMIKGCDICVAFLTADDVFEAEGGLRRRLRQNVVFELGMAILQLGREHCILLSDFDAHAPDFDLPSDMTSLEILTFKKDNLDTVLDQVVQKMLRMLKKQRQEDEETLQYDHLLTRSEYYIDYENIFDFPGANTHEGLSFLTATLDFWTKECGAMPHYDEKCMYLLERLGFIPIFGSIPETFAFMEACKKQIEQYYRPDVRYYGGTSLLNFLRNVIFCVIEYTRIKTEKRSDASIEEYERLLHDFLSEPIPEETALNPLILLVYFDFLGLTYLRLFDRSGDKAHLQSALSCLERAGGYIPRVDMGLRIWEGFLIFNLARVYERAGEPRAKALFERAVDLRKKWIDHSGYNVTVRNALSYEYFVAKIRLVDYLGQTHELEKDKLLGRYRDMETELKDYTDVDKKLVQLQNIWKMLRERCEETD